MMPVPKHIDAGSCGPAGPVPGMIDGLCSLFAGLTGGLLFRGFDGESVKQRMLEGPAHSQQNP